jgi:hypothetical protein
MSFAEMPDDSQLTSLLGDPDCGPLRAVEEDGVLIVRPWLLPMKFIAPWMIFVMAVITVMAYMWKEEQFGIFVAITFMGWVLVLPALLTLFFFMNRSSVKKGDYFKLYTAKRTLELCQLGRTFEASEILAITLLTRWHGTTNWDKTHQTGVLVRGRENQIELYPVIRELGNNVALFQKSRWADQLAEVFQVPIRQVELSREESRALNDF